MPAEPLVAQIDWQSVEEAIQKELKGSSRHRPPSTLFRWWARRPYELIGAILDAATSDRNRQYMVSDPFSGSCTVALEAYLRGHRAFAQDINPWPLTGMQIATNQANAEEIWEVGSQLLKDLRARSISYQVRCEEHPSTELLTAFWVRNIPCPKCGVEVYTYPYGLATVASRNGKEDFGYFGCTTCGEVTKGKLTAEKLQCRSCQRYLNPANHSLMKGRMLDCKICGERFKAYDYQHSRWKLSLVQRKCIGHDGKTHTHFAYPNETDLKTEECRDIPLPLRQPIEAGVETNILRRAGFLTWADLYPARQLNVLLEAVRLAQQVDNRSVQEQILLAICGAAETPGFLARWDRYYPKVFGATDNHRFAPIGFAAEVNPIATQGRGTLHRRLQAARKAVKWHKDVRAKESTARGSIEFNVGSSANQPLASNSIDIVLTDPPYYGDIQYWELATPLNVWGESVGIISPVDASRIEEEAVPNRCRGTGLDEYSINLNLIIKETERTLKKNGKMLMTFHNRDLRAWYSLSKALEKADLWIHACVTVRTELANDHSKNSPHSFTRDLVIEASKQKKVGSVLTWTGENSLQAKELVAAGMMMASRCTSFEEAVNSFHDFWLFASKLGPG